MLNGITVALYSRTLTGEKDGFGRPRAVESVIYVPDVLVYPSTSDDIPTTLDLTGKKAIYTLCIPKGDTNEWEDSKIEFFGHTWHSFGFVTEYIEENIPLRWNKKVLVERYE